MCLLVEGEDTLFIYFYSLKKKICLLVEQGDTVFFSFSNKFFKKKSFKEIIFKKNFKKKSNEETDFFLKNLKENYFKKYF